MDLKLNKDEDEIEIKSIFGGDEKWKSRRRKTEGRKSILKHIVKRWAKRNCLGELGNAVEINKKKSSSEDETKGREEKYVLCYQTP